MAVEFIRVKSISTGHEYSLPADAFDKDAHKKIAGPAEEDGVVVPPVLNEQVGEVEDVPETVAPKPVNTDAKK